MASEQKNGWLNLPRWYLRLGGILLGLAMCLWPARLEGVITRLTPLKEVLAGEKFIVVAKIDKIDPDNHTVLLKVDENLKGKPSFSKIPLNLNGDSEGQKEKHPAAMLKRLAPGISLIVFASPNKQNTRYSAFGFTEGTWFQMIGQVDKEDATLVRWNFTHCEPYLRRTFKGTTAELRQVIIDGLEGKKPPPEPNPKEQPGLGPEINSGDSPKDRSKNSKMNCGGKLDSGPHWAVIPTFSFVGPFALLASLFPAVFGGLTLVFKRWRSLLWVASVNSTLYLLHSWFERSIKDYWWGKPAANWMIMAGVTVCGAVWSWHRYRAATPEERSAALMPQKSEKIILVLLALVFACAGLGAIMVSRDQKGVSVVWVFEPDEVGTIISSPLLLEDRIVVAAALGSPTQRFGALYCLNSATGTIIWRFDNDGRMKQVSISSPCLGGGRLYIGEGFHEDSDCKLYCLEARSGEKLWDFQTKSHTESSPCVAGDKVFFGAGDDGVYCLNAKSGEPLWNFTGVHVDCTPAIQDNRLYAGSGYGPSYEAFCLDAETGKPIWRQTVALPVWGSPVTAGDKVFIGLGNGDFLNSADQPAGSLVCFHAPTGNILWIFPVPDGVLMHPVLNLEKHRIYFASRDQFVYCLDSQEGKLQWKVRLGSPIVTSPALAENNLYVAASQGRVACLQADTGELQWDFDVRQFSQQTPRLFSSPAAFGRRIYFGAGLENVNRYVPALYCLEEK